MPRPARREVDSKSEPRVSSTVRTVLPSCNVFVRAAPPIPRARYVESRGVGDSANIEVEGDVEGTCLIGMVDGIGRLPSGEQVATALW